MIAVMAKPPPSSRGSAGIAIQMQMHEAGLTQKSLGKRLKKSQTWVSQSLFDDAEKTLRRMYINDPDELEHLVKVLKWSVEELQAATNVTLTTGEAVSVSRLTLAQQQAREQAVQDFLAEVRPGTHTSVFDSGAGPSWMDEDPSTWIIEDPELFRKYPNLGTHRIVGSSVEPFAFDGDIAYVVPDRELIASGRLVLIWLSDNGRVVKFLAHEDADGEHLVIQSNPDTEFRTPPGSALLGVVVGIRKMGVPKLPIKRIIEAITERMPYLLEEDQ